jgi:hypothetical protein
VGFAFFGAARCGSITQQKTMKATSQTLKTKFAPETRFNVTPMPAVPFRGIWETELEQLKRRLLLEHLRAARDPGLYAPIRRAAHEAAGLAWTMPYPLLLLPVLMEEHVAEAKRHYRRQVRVWRESRELLRAVA